MSIFKQRLSKKTKIQATIIGLIILAIVALIILDIIFHGPLTTALTNKDEILSFVNSLGFLGPLAFILLQAFQTVIAPIPGNVSGAIGGFLFGWWGILWTTIGSAIGFFVVFWLSRRFGRRFVEKIIKKSSLEKFDYLAKERGAFVFFLIFLIPGLPDDIVGYLAGLTAIPIKKLMAMAIIGRMPAVIATNMFGAGLGESDIRPVIVIAIISAVILAIIAVKREAIMRWIRAQEHRHSVKPKPSSKDVQPVPGKDRHPTKK